MFERRADVGAKTARFSAAASSGPDLGDVSGFLRALNDLHGITVKFTIECGPGYYVGAAIVTLSATAPVLVGSGRAWDAVIREGYPSHKYKTLEQVMYALCHKLDSLAARELWRQESLF